jgi:hypothetical protein
MDSPDRSPSSPYPPDFLSDEQRTSDVTRLRQRRMSTQLKVIESFIRFTLVYYLVCVCVPFCIILNQTILCDLPFFPTVNDNYTYRNRCKVISGICKNYPVFHLSILTIFLYFITDSNILCARD